MNQKSITVKLRDFTEDDHPFGNVQGKATFGKLLDFVHSHPQYSVFGISLTGIEATDASFPRESVVAVAKFFRGSVASSSRMSKVETCWTTGAMRPRPKTFL